MRFLTRILLPALLTALIVGGAAVALLVRSTWKDLPEINVAALRAPHQSLVFQDKNGDELYRFYDDNDRSFVSLSTLGKTLPNAFIAVEDKRFYQRSCIDIRALIRAALANLTAYKSQGASTITQQLVRTIYLSREKTFERKLREILLACEMEQILSKDDILELYLNWIHFGHGIAGVRQASRKFFSLEPSELSTAQIAVLASLPQRPSYFSPFGPHRTTTVETRENTASSEESAEDEKIVTEGLLPIVIDGVRIPGRSDTVLQLMREQDLLTDDEWLKADIALADLRFQHGTNVLQVPHLTLSLKADIDELLKDDEAAKKEGITVHTTIDPIIQKIVESVVQKRMPTMTNNYGAENVSVIVVQKSTNEILAYVGNTDFFDDEHGGEIDMIRAPRQTGSSFKPIVYAGYMEQGATPQTTIYDNPQNSAYVPYHSGYYGKMTVRTALARSRNIPAVRAFFGAGGEDVILQLAAAMGAVSPLARKIEQEDAGNPFTYGWTLALGAGEASLLEMVQAYSVIARDGIMKPITAVSSIESSQGRTIFSNSTNEKRVLQTSTALGLISILSDEQAREPNWRSFMKLPYGPAAVKTGTGTFCGGRDLRGACRILVRNNNWTIGFDDDIITGVWIGNVDNKPIWEDALLMATPIWKDVMTQTHDILSFREEQMPPVLMQLPQQFSDHLPAE